MVAIILPLVVAIIGLLTYAFASNAKLAECGRILFFCGALVLTSHLASEVIRL